MSISQSKRFAAFSLVELVIVVVIIGVIAAIAVPRISRGAKGAGDASMRMSLQGIRNAIDMYSAEHGGKFPDGSQGSGTQADIEAQLTNKTEFDGATTVDDSGDELGPYLRTGFPTIPVGAKKGENTVKIITSGAIAGTDIDDSTAWVYSTVTGEFKANSTGTDASGTVYSTY
ncbi:MAG: prepilin-type N-terminal cleavage/methylation domain-containing protein [Phycisphaerae bacterium]|nr:prepilin-type N-terminal cleavage/methylation domain-containing protein [Phycisphaerae bacterium]